MASFSLKREIPVETGYDVIVVGGGPAGVAAAVAAGRAGAKVALLEATGCLGGMGTSGLVTAFDGMADGASPLVGGIMREIVETLYDRGWLPSHVQPKRWRKMLLCPTPFRPEPLKVLLDEMASDAGVEVRFFSRLIDADVDQTSRRVHGVVVHQVDGYHYLAAPAFVDATGDAFLCDYCGAAYEQAGRDTEHIMPSSLCWVGAGIDFSRAGKPGDYVEEARAQGDFPYKLFRSIMGRMDSGMAGFNAGHLYDLDALSATALSNGMAEGRRIAQNYTDFYRKHVPGYEEMAVASTASLMGVRESRRVVGEYRLTIDDYRGWRKFPDQIGVFNKEIDIHVYTDDPRDIEEHHRRREAREDFPNPGDAYGIPYGVIVPKGWENLWVAGRCASCDVTVHGSLRVMPAAAMMGQAAGIAAVQAIRSDQTACDLDTRQLVLALREAGANLPQEDLSETMTRCALPGS
jgi:FAD-dependent oxidoreductase family protein